MSDETQTIRDGAEWPVVVHPGPASIEELFRNIDPAPDGETERFVAAIYAERREGRTLLASVNRIVVDTDIASCIFNWHSSAKRYVDALRGFQLVLCFMSIAGMRMAR
jgi:hypothetical protein